MTDGWLIDHWADEGIDALRRLLEGVLFKRDFGSFWLDNFPDIEVLDYGFAWKRVTAMDNVTWWIFKKV